MEDTSTDALPRLDLQVLDLTGCPLTALFSRFDTDRSIEERYFRGWDNAMAMRKNSPSGWRSVSDGGRTVLEHIEKGDQCFITGDWFWQDYRVATRIRQFTAGSRPGADDEYCFTARNGIMFRLRTVRHYYFFCLEGYDRVVLYRRSDDDYIALASRPLPIDRSRYYDMVIEGQGDLITCHLDGRPLFRVRDSSYPTGKAGIRANSLVRFGKVAVDTTGAAQLRYQAVRAAFDRGEAAEEEKYPRPVLAYTIDVRRYKPWAVRWADLRGRGKYDLVLFGQPGEGGAPGMVTAIDLEGHELWQVPITSRLARPVDIDGDGREGILALTKERMVLISHDGEVVNETPMPESHPYCQPRGSVLDPLFGPYIVDLSGVGRPTDVVLVDDRDGHGGHTMWAYNSDLEMMWRATIDQPPFGHNPTFYDVNGDGREECVAGYVLLSADGEVMWQVDGSQYLDRFQAARHVDSEAAGDFDGNPANGCEIFMAAGSEGLLLVDANTGLIRAHHPVGHAQGITVGRYRMDVPGLQAWCGCRWGNIGILTLLSGEGDVLHKFQPDFVGEGGHPVNWGGDGLELYLMCSSERTLGMWDGYGRRVVQFREGPGADVLCSGRAWGADFLGDARDEVIFVTPGWLFIYTQDQPYPKGTRIYAPLRRRGLEAPVVSYPGWQINA